MPTQSPSPIPLDSPKAFLNRELSWLNFAERVVEMVEDRDIPLLERLKFAGIAGMLHDEFFMKRISGLKRQMAKRSSKLSLDGLRPEEEFRSCRRKLLKQVERLGKVVEASLRQRLAEEGLPIRNHRDLDVEQQRHLQDYFRRSVMPILTPLTADSEHPFPFISNRGLNLGIVFRDEPGRKERFVRIKVPDNRPRWVPLPDSGGFVPLEQIIAANLDALYPTTPPRAIHLFRVTRGAEGETDGASNLNGEDPLDRPGNIIDQVSSELKARRFAGVVRLEVDKDMPQKFKSWLARQLQIGADDIYPTQTLLGLSDLMELPTPDRDDLRFAGHVPVTHARLRHLHRASPQEIFEEIDRGDILLHHPYHSFDTSVLRLLESAAADPAVLAIKLTIYRTNRDSPIVRALADAARRGKQVAVLVEVTARFDEAPNIAWGRYLETEGVHVAYGVEQLKTHVKLGLVVREEGGQIRSYAHIGTGNYHTGTARLYEDLGVLTGDPAICSEVASVFNTLTGAMPYADHQKMLVAPFSLRRRLNEMIRREADNARAGRPCGIDAKMNQLQDPDIIRELYRAAQAGVPIRLNVRGLCCLRPGVPGLSETIQVFSVVGRFLEHSRIYRFTNADDPEYFIGSADWMKRNLNSRVETVAPILDEDLKRELDAILAIYYEDNCSAWDCGPDGVYHRRTPGDQDIRRASQETFIRLARDEQPESAGDAVTSHQVGIPALVEAGGGVPQRSAGRPRVSPTSPSSRHRPTARQLISD